MASTIFLNLAIYSGNLYMVTCLTYHSQLYLSTRLWIIIYIIIDVICREIFWRDFSRYWSVLFWSKWYPQVTRNGCCRNSHCLGKFGSNSLCFKGPFYW